MVQKSIFGFKIGKKEEKENIQPSFIPPSAEDGSFTVTSAAQFGSTTLDMDGSTKNEVELITRYREISMQPELAAAIDDIVNEAIVHDDSGKSVEIVMDKLKQSDKIKRAIEEEFKHILRLLNFDNIGSDIFQRYYIDGRLFYHIIIDPENPQKGIKELRYIDPRKIRKIRELAKQRDNVTGMEVITNVKEYYIFSDKVLSGPTNSSSAQGLKISPDAILNVNSGLVDAKRGMVLSYLHSAIKPLNQLRMVEDATVIYRLCLIGTTRIKTNSGWKYIKDVKRDDILYSYYGPNLHLQETKVKVQWKTGTKQTYKVFSKHFDIIGTDNHPILVYDKQDKSVSYVNIMDIDPNIHYFVYPKPNNLENNFDFVDENTAKSFGIKFCHTKTIPEWIYQTSNEIKKQFILGIAETIGTNEDDVKSGTWSSKITMNRPILEHIKEIWTSIGLSSIFSNDYIILFDENLPEFEKIMGVVLEKIEDVYEIEVESEKHNFIANGIVVHNSRAPERRIFYIDVGNLNKIKAEQHVKDVMTKYRNKLVYNSCLALTTEIPLLDGRTLPLSEIIDKFNEGESLWAYSCNPETGKFAPGIITEALITKKNEEVLKITLSNKKSITCTLDHKFPVFGKGFVEAQNLALNDEIIPFYVKTLNNSIKIFDNVEKNWDYVSNRVSYWLNDPNFTSYKDNEEDLEIPETIFICGIDILTEKMDVGTLAIDTDELFHDYHTFALEAGIYTKNSTGQVQSEYRHLCLKMDTKVPLLDGRILTLEEISNEYQEKELWVYSCHPITGEFAPGLITWAGVSNPNAEIMRITLDNEKTIECTPEHKFPVWDHGIVEAKNLNIGDLMIPLYKTENQFYDNYNKKWVDIRQEISKWKDSIGMQNDSLSDFIDKYINSESGFKEGVSSPTITKIEYLSERYDTGCLTIDGEEIYHNYHTFALEAGIYTQNSLVEDFWMPRRSDGRSTEITTLPGGCFSMDTKVSLLDGRELSIKEIELELSEGKELWTYSCEPITGKVVPGLVSWAGVTQKSAKVMEIIFENGKNIICTPEHKFPVYDKEYKEAREFVIGDCVIPLYKTHNKDFFDNKDKLWKRFQNVTEELKDEFIKEIDVNNRIQYIRYLDNPIEVGTLTIDSDEKYHDYHTFALSCGVFTFNSNLGQMEDVMYFERKLYKSLNVPITRLDPSQATSVGRSTEITRDELKFSKFVSKLRKRFSDLFDQALRVQLSLKGVCTEDEWKIFKEDVYYDFLKDNNFVELKETELLQSRLGVLGMISQFCPNDREFYSKKWISRHVLRLNDLEVEDMEQEIADDTEMAFQKQAETQKQQILLQKQAMDLQNELMPQQEPEGQEGQDQDNPYLQHQKQ